MDAISMDKMLYSYPEQESMDARGVQELMYKRLEFSELQTDAQPRRISPGDYFPYQALGQRYMFPYDRMLCIMEPGTGKTCYNIGIAEKVRMINNWVDSTIDLRNNIKRCYVLTSSDLLVSEFNYQFICRCTDGRYMSERIASAQRSTGRSLQVNKIVREFYEVKNYYTFYKSIRDLSPEQMVERYSDCLFFLDEVHTFRNSDTQSEKNTSLAYAKIHELIHTAQRIKVVLNTATPMMDNVNEIIPLINFIVSTEEQLDESEGIEGRSFEEMSALLKGKVVFVRSVPFKLNVVENGVELRVPTADPDAIESDVSIKVVPVLLSEFQTDAYYETYGTRAYTDNSYLNTIQRAAFYAPDPELNRVRDGPGQSSMVVNEGFREILENLDEYSAKFGALIDSIKYQEGTHFVYWNYLEGGLNILAALLLTDGFERFTGTVSPYQREVGRGRRQETSVMSEYCVSTDADGESVFTKFSSAFPKRLRFAILSGTNKAVHSRLIKEVMVHPDNIDGDYIKVLIASPVAKLGINLSNIRWIHNLGAHWNMGNLNQAEGRAIRAESHVDMYNRLMRSKREKLEAGLPLTEEEEAEMVNIYINRYCAVPRFLEPSYLESLGFSYEDPTDEMLEFMINNISNPEIVPHLSQEVPEILRGVDIEQYPLSIDVYMYRRSVEKELEIRKMIRTMKRIAIDCNNNMDRNRIYAGIPGTLECDYQECDYVCEYDPAVEDPTGELKGSEQESYAALYLDDVMEQCRRLVDEEVDRLGAVSWSDLVSLLDERSGELAVRHQAFQRIVGEYDQVYRLDRRGMPQYLMSNQHGVWTSNYLSSAIDGDVVPNVHRFLEKTPLARVIEDLNASEFSYSDQDIEDIIDDSPFMTLARKLAILESGILNRDQRILDLFAHYIYELPRKTLRTYREGNRIVYEGRVVPGETELIHTYPSETKSSYIVSSLYKSIPTPASKSRIYDRDRRRWRNMNDRDYMTYRDDMQKTLDEKTALDSDIVAYTNTIDYRLRLINYRQHRESRAGMDEDIRAMPRGLLCFNWPLDLLGETLYDVDADAFMSGLLGQLSRAEVYDHYSDSLDRLTLGREDLEPLREFFDRIIRTNQQFSFRDLDYMPDEDAVTPELLRSLANIQYNILEGRPHPRFDSIRWTIPRLVFMNLLMLAYTNSSGPCADLDIETIFDRHGLLYRM